MVWPRTGSYSGFYEVRPMTYEALYPLAIGFYTCVAMAVFFGILELLAIRKAKRLKSDN